MWFIITVGEHKPHADSARKLRILRSERMYAPNFFATGRITIGEHKPHADSARKFRILRSERMYAPNFFATGRLCLDNQEFAGYEMAIAFWMIDRSLISVTLFTTYSEQQYLDLITALASRFQLVGIASGDESMDIILFSTWEIGSSTDAADG